MSHMSQQKQLKKCKIQNEGYEFTFSYDSKQKQLQASIRNKATEQSARNKFTYETLPNVLNVLFEDVEGLFTFLSTLPKESILYQSDQSIHLITLKLSILGKEKKFSLPIYYVQESNPKIKEYQNNIQKVCQDNRRLTVELRTAQEKIQRLERELKYAKDKIHTLQQEVQYMEVKSKKRPLSESQVNAPMLIPSKSSYKLPLDSTEYQLTSIFNNQELYKFTIDGPSNSLYFRFQESKIMVKDQFKDFHQIVSRDPLSLKQRNVVRIRINKSSKNNIYFGIMKQIIKVQKFTCQHQQAISYKLCGGKFLFEDGRQSGEQTCKIKIGDVFCLIMDPIKYQITWFVDKVFMFKRFLPSKFQNVSLYPFVSMHDVGDEIEFI